MTPNTFDGAGPRASGLRHIRIRRSCVVEGSHPVASHRIPRNRWRGVEFARGTERDIRSCVGAGRPQRRWAACYSARHGKLRERGSHTGHSPRPDEPPPGPQADGGERYDQRLRDLLARVGLQDQDALSSFYERDRGPRVCARGAYHGTQRRGRGGMRRRVSAGVARGRALRANQGTVLGWLLTICRSRRSTPSGDGTRPSPTRTQTSCAPQDQAPR